MHNSNSTNLGRYLSSAWQQHAELITHLCHFSQNILLILGQSQSGKSTFFEYFTNVPSSSLKICAKKATQNTDVEVLLQEVANGFDLAWEDASQTIDALKTKALDSYRQANETWVLMIDDAHLLNDEQITTLLQLVQFNGETREQLHLVMLGEPSLEARLFTPALCADAQGKIYSIELESWTLHDIKRYVAKEKLLSQMSAERIADIFARTQGLPGQVAHEVQLLQNSFTEEVNSMTKQTAKRWTHPIALGAVTGFLLGGAYLLFNNAQEDEIMNAPVNAAQIEEGWGTKSSNKPRLDASDEKMAMEEEPAPIVQTQQGTASTMLPEAKIAVATTTVMPQVEPIAKATSA
ncbi:MAG TPA: ATP-binding protein, partial [Candidatus Berkiella sp.]|nr:ATP-binding protein [Candidatus Berkiella sp.]